MICIYIYKMIYMLLPRHPGRDVCRILWRMWISSGWFPLGPQTKFHRQCMNWRSSICVLCMLCQTHVKPAYQTCFRAWPRWDGSPSVAWLGRLATCELKWHCLRGVAGGSVRFLSLRSEGIFSVETLHEIRIPNLSILYNQGKVVTFARTVSRRTWGVHLGFYGSSDWHCGAVNLG